MGLEFLRRADSNLLGEDVLTWIDKLHPRGKNHEIMDHYLSSGALMQMLCTIHIDIDIDIYYDIYVYIVGSTYACSP